ncbi:MAG: AraC family transcriptional regulator [Eubacteriales bacterium]|nr:AraC family transcriptional regulator [Eubacteriales bacterium]
MEDFYLFWVYNENKTGRADGGSTGMKENGKAKIDAYKELTPVVYGENAIKYLYFELERKVGQPCFSMHWHDRMELLYVTTGALRLFSGEESFPVRAGQAAAMGPRQLHCGIAEEEKVAYHTIMFDVEKFFNGTAASERYLRPLAEGKVFFGQAIGDPELTGQVDRLTKQLSGRPGEGRADNPLLAVGLLYGILGELYRYSETCGETAAGTESGFSQVLRYVNENYTKKLGPREVSARFGYNETYFCRRFREVTGITFLEYIRALRMEYAQRLLRGSRDGIGEIAWKCGYPDAGYFSNSFKRLFGFTPGEFRRMG